MAKTALITGILGQDGSYLCELLLDKGYRVIGTSHRHPQTLLVQQQQVSVVHLDLSDANAIKDLLLATKPDEIYHLASRSSSSQLFDDSMAIADINALSTVRFLEVIRQHLPSTKFCQAGSSEVFAASKETPQDENTLMCPVNAYGAAKAYTRHLVNAYRHQYDVRACTAILFNHESPRRGPQYVTRKICRAAAAISLGLEHSLVLGNLDSMRDWGHAKDTVRGMWMMLQPEYPEDMVLATGVLHSVRDLCEGAFSRVGLQYEQFVKVQQDRSRRNETVLLCGDARRARKVLGWQPQICFETLLDEMVEADLRALRISQSN